MKICHQCGKKVLSGHIVCSDCKAQSDPLIPIEYYISQLAEEIVLDYKGMCDLCERRQCDSQVSGIVCLHGIEAYLLSRIQIYAANQKNTPREACDEQAHVCCYKNESGGKSHGDK